MKILKSRRVIFVLTIRFVCMVFVTGQFADIFIYPWWIAIVTIIVSRRIQLHNVFNSFVKYSFSFSLFSLTSIFALQNVSATRIHISLIDISKLAF